MSYYYSPFLTFFFIFFFFLLILIILSPNYLKREIATPLGASNYAVGGTGGVINVGDFETVSFKDMTMSDNEAGDDNIRVSFVPDFSIMSERLVGFFHLKLTAAARCELIFRTYDRIGSSLTNTIKDYNKGWSAVSINTPGTIKPLYNVYVPFDIPSLSNKNSSHEITVQIASTSYNGTRGGTITAGNVELNSADVYFLPY